MAPLGVDVVWNPRLADSEFIAWLRGILVEAIAATEALAANQSGTSSR